MSDVHQFAASFSVEGSLGQHVQEELAESKVLALPKHPEQLLLLNRVFDHNRPSLHKKHSWFFDEDWFTRCVGAGIHALQ